MARPRSPFRQQDVTRAVRGVIAAGREPSRAEIDREGKIVVIIAETVPAPHPSPEPEPTPPGDIIL